MEKTSIRQIRNKRGLTQEALAELMQVDVTTVQRWEMGKVEPNLQNIKRLRELLGKADGLNHPFFAALLEQDVPIAMLDGFAIYRRANRPFRLVQGKLGVSGFIDRYAGDLSSFWSETVPRISGLNPEELATSDVSNIEVSQLVPDTVARKMALRHSVTVARQEKFTSVIIHQMEEIPHDSIREESVVVTRRMSR